MKQKPAERPASSERIIRDIKRKTRKQYSAEEKILIVLESYRHFALKRMRKALDGTDKLTHTRGLELQNSCGDSIITDRWFHLERNLMQKEAEYSHF
jgi:hypothetical protein